MSQIKRIIQLIFYTSLAALLIINSRITYTSIENSLDRCIHSLLPAIFPFLILSKQIAAFITVPNSRLFNKITKILFNNKDIFSLFILSLFVGYPVPAMLVYKKYTLNELSKNDAEKAVYILNGASPSFYTLFVGKVIFGSAQKGFLLYVCQKFSELILIYLFKFSDRLYMPNTTLNINLSVNIKEAATTFINICGTTIYFGIIADTLNYLLSKTGILSTFTSILCAIPEVVNGIYILSEIPLQNVLLFICFLCSSGGLSAFYQIKAVTDELNITFKKYFYIKAIMSVVMYVVFNILSILKNAIYIL